MRCYNNVQREEAKYVFNQYFALRTDKLNCLNEAAQGNKRKKKRHVDNKQSYQFNKTQQGGNKTS